MSRRQVNGRRRAPKVPPPERPLSGLVDDLEAAGFEVCSRYGEADATRAALDGKAPPWTLPLPPAVPTSLKVTKVALGLARWSLIAAAGLVGVAAVALLADWLREKTRLP